MVLGATFCISGVALAIVGYRHLARRREFIRHSAVVLGVVTGLRDEGEGTNVQRLYYPRVRFRADSGRDVTFESGTARGGTELQVGQAVPVRYRMDRPEMAELDNVSTLWGPAIVFALLAVVFAAAGVSIWLGLIA